MSYTQTTFLAASYTLVSRYEAEHHTDLLLVFTDAHLQCMMASVRSLLIRTTKTGSSRMTCKGLSLLSCEWLLFVDRKYTYQGLRTSPIYESLK